MSSVDAVAAAAAAFQDRVNKRLAGLKGEGLVIHAVVAFGSGPDKNQWISVVVTDDSPAAQQRIIACLNGLRRPVEIVKRVAVFEAEPGEDTGDDI